MKNTVRRMCLILKFNTTLTVALWCKLICEYVKLFPQLPRTILGDISPEGSDLCDFVTREQGTLDM